MKNRLLLALFLLCAIIITGCGSKNVESKPKENSADHNAGNEFALDGDVEFVVPASAGGGSDINARMVSEIIKENNLIDKNIMVVNKPGGSTAVGNSYTHSKKGSNNTIMTWVSSQQFSPILNNNDVTLEDLTPLGTLAIDNFLFVVEAGSEYETLEDVFEAARENPQQITIGGTGEKTEDHLLTHLINKHGDTDFKYIPFDGGADTVPALLGGHIDVIIANPNLVSSQIKAGKMKALAVTTKERLEGDLSEVPTFTELGYPEIELVSFRGYVGPPDMSGEAIEFWENVLKQVSETEKWQNEYVKKYNLQGEYLNAADSRVFYEEVLEHNLNIAKEMGILNE